MCATILPKGAHVRWLMPMSRAPGAVLIATADPGVRTDSPGEDAADPGVRTVLADFRPVATPNPRVRTE